MVLGVAELVAVFAATTPLATAEAVCPPTETTIVAVWEPVTSPNNDPVKLAAVVAEVAMVADDALPARSPVNDPAN